VIGSGIAGLYAALTAASRARVALLTKGGLDDGCSRYAQGGLAAAVGADDSIELHYQDTIDAGRGLCHADAVRVLVGEGGARVRELLDWGVTFDTQDGELLLAREAAHSRARIVHARGDGTGLEIESALIRRVRDAGITIMERTEVVRLLIDDGGRCIGVETVDTHLGTTGRVAGSAVVLASGGASRLWRNSTNPESATGDGVALAFEAGAEVRGMEFVQFHPTALALEAAPRFLISEAVRGEGAIVVNDRGRRFLLDAHPAGELAGRDVVARAMWDELRRTGAACVYIDCQPLGPAAALRFPAIATACRQFGIDITRDRIPVAPAAHYMIGGVSTDLDGATTVPGLYACGEVASSGVHGANRLASNSLLESAVFAHRAAGAAVASLGEAEPPRLASAAAAPLPLEVSPEVRSLWSGLQDSLWNHAGVVRERAGLRLTMDVAAEAGGSAERSLPAARLRAAARTAALVCSAALAREESRGCHLRSDFTRSSDQWHGDYVMHKERGARLDSHV
jgi:L-aspartate oxidase